MKESRAWALPCLAFISWEWLGSNRPYSVFAEGQLRHCGVPDTAYDV